MCLHSVDLLKLCNKSETLLVTIEEHDTSYGICFKLIAIQRQIAAVIFLLALSQ
jgi:hypothetical protein